MPPILYVDATGGGMILQIVLSGFVGGAVVLKMFWQSILNAIPFRKNRDHGQPPIGDSGEVETPAA